MCRLLNWHLFSLLDEGIGIKIAQTTCNRAIKRKDMVQGHF